MYNPQLDTFITVADCGSFSKAAESLYITPTAVILERLCRLRAGSKGVRRHLRHGRVRKGQDRRYARLYAGVRNGQSRLMI